MAKSYTGERDNEALAVSQFKDVLGHANMSFNIKSFPSNESGELAFIKCNDQKSAQAYCPQRWKALQAWIQNTIKVSTRFILVLVPTLLATRRSRARFMRSFQDFRAKEKVVAV